MDRDQARLAIIRGWIAHCDPLAAAKQINRMEVADYASEAALDVAEALPSRDRAGWLEAVEERPAVWAGRRRPLLLQPLDEVLREVELAARIAHEDLPRPETLPLMGSCPHGALPLTRLQRRGRAIQSQVAAQTARRAGTAVAHSSSKCVAKLPNTPPSLRRWR